MGLLTLLGRLCCLLGFHNWYCRHFVDDKAWPKYYMWECTRCSKRTWRKANQLPPKFMEK